MVNEQIVRFQVYAAHLWQCGQNYLAKGMPLMAQHYFSASADTYRSARRLLIGE